MAANTPLPHVELHRFITRSFSEEELRTLCFDLQIDYDNLTGSNKEAKARELVTWFDRRERLVELEVAVRRVRPTFSPERARALQEYIAATPQPDVRDAFAEFMTQIQSYLNEFNLLHEQLEEWKEVHNALHNIQNDFAPCRSYVFTIGRIVGSAKNDQLEVDQLEAALEALRALEKDWRPCYRNLHKLRELAESIRAIGEPFDPKTDLGPDWFLTPWRTADSLNRALLDTNIRDLTEFLSSFGDQVDWKLYVVDKALRDVVSRINRLPRSGFFATRS